MDTPIDSVYIRDMLMKHSLAVLSTVTPENLPDAAPIYYIANFKHEIYFVTSAQTQKVHNIHHQKNVIMTIVDDSLTETLRVQGVAEEHADMLDDILQQLAQKLHYGASFLQSLPALKYKDQKKTVFKITPSQIRLRRFTEYSFTEKVVDFPAQT